MSEADDVELAQTGTVTNYTVVTPQYYGQEETEPFVRTTISLDPPGGSLMPPGHPRRARRPGRTEACGSRRSGPTSRTATSTRSTTGPAGVRRARSRDGSPPASPTCPEGQYTDEGLPDEPWLHNSTAIIGYAQSPSWRQAEQTENQFLYPVMLMPEAIGTANVDTTIDDIGFTCAGTSDYLSGQTFTFVIKLDGGGRMAADLGEPRRDGRRMGDLRGVDPSATRGHRHRAARFGYGQVARPATSRVILTRSRSTRTRWPRSA